jgi:hypothetical protein
MAGRGLLAAALLAASAAAGGCCATPGGFVRGDRDTPERAFAFVRDAFVHDSVGDQAESFHRAFLDRQGFSRSQYELARSLRPGLFEKAARLLASAEVRSVEGGVLETRRREEDPPRPRAAARVTVETASGTGVFLLVDEPVLTVFPLAPGEPEVRGHPGDLDRILRFEGETAILEARVPADYPPEGPFRVRRVEIHHDWLLWDIESLRGFEELLGEVRAAAAEEEAKGAKGGGEAAR